MLHKSRQGYDDGKLPPKTREYYECGYDQDYRPDKEDDHRHLPGLAGKECGEHEYIIDNAIGQFI